MADERATYARAPKAGVHITNLSYMEADGDHPFRAIGIGFSNGLIVTLTAESLQGIMDKQAQTMLHETYIEACSNIVLNEQEYWFAGKDPRLSYSLVF